MEDALVPPQAWHPVLWACTRLVVNSNTSFSKRVNRGPLRDAPASVSGWVQGLTHGLLRGIMSLQILIPGFPWWYSG